MNRLAAEAAYRSGAVGRSLSLQEAALAGLPPGFDPVRRALLLEQRGHALRDASRPAESVAALQEALALLPAEPATRAHAAVLAALARSLIHVSDMQAAAEEATRAVAAARACGAKDAEADAAITLGGASTYLGSGEDSLTFFREGLRLALDIGASMIAMAGYVNLSDALEFLGRHEEAAQTAAEGLDLARRAGLIRSEGPYLMMNQAEPLLRLGRWAEAERVLAQGLAVMPEGVFAGGLELKRGTWATGTGHRAWRSRHSRPCLAACVQSNSGTCKTESPLPHRRSPPWMPRMSRPPSSSRPTSRRPLSACGRASPTLHR